MLKKKHTHTQDRKNYIYMYLKNEKKFPLKALNVLQGFAIDKHK